MLLWLSWSDKCFPLAKSWFLSPFQNTLFPPQTVHMLSKWWYVLPLVIKQQFYSNCLKKCCILNICWHCVVTLTSVQRSGACLKTFGGIKGTLDVYTYLFNWKYQFCLLSLCLTGFIYSGLLKTFQQSNTIREFHCLLWEQRRWNNLDFRGHTRTPIYKMFLRKKIRYQRYVLWNRTDA